MDQEQKDALVVKAIMKAKSDHMYITQDGTRLYVKVPGTEEMLMFGSADANFNAMTDEQLNDFLIDIISKLME